MDLWVLTGYVAHAILTASWFWVIASTAPQLRRGTRDRRIRVRVLLIKSAALALTALLVAIIHYWSTTWWQVVVALPPALALGMLLRREYRRTVAAPRHRLTLTQRARTLDRHRKPRSGHAPSHLRVEEAGPTVTARLAD